MKKLKVYIAGPYSGGDVMTNISSILHIADVLMRENFVPFVPHLSGFWHFHSYKEYDTWLEYDLEWLEACDVVYRCYGESPGADKEVAHAEKLGIPIVSSMHEIRAWRETR